MPAFSYDGLSSNQITDLARLASAAYADTGPPAGWSNLVFPTQGGPFNGSVYSNESAEAEVFLSDDGQTLTLAFRGTDEADDLFDYLGVVTGNYLNRFNPLFVELQSYIAANPVASIHVTGHSLGAAAANLLRDSTGSVAQGLFEDASFVTFATPVVAGSTDILNIGMENDWVFETVERFFSNGPNFSSNTDHIVWYNETAWESDNSGSDPRLFSEFLGRESDYPHAIANHIKAVERITDSFFYDAMTRDSIIIVAATNLPISAFGPGSTDTFGPTFFLGQASGDYIQGTTFGDFIEGNNGDDVLEGRGGNDNIRGGAGFDEIWGGTGNDTMDGGSGQDVVYYLDSGIGISVNMGLAGSNVSSGLGNDRITAIEDVVATDMNDVLRGDGANNLLVGLGGNDLVVGNGGDDTLFAGDGQDTLDGGAGNDVLDATSTTNSQQSGGIGEDSFVFSTFGGTHTISDFEDGFDFLIIDTLGAGSFADLTISQTGANTVVDLDTLSVTLLGVQATALGVDDVLVI